MKQHTINPSGDVYRKVLYNGKGEGYNEAVLRLGTGCINITYKVSSVRDNRITWFFTWARYMGNMVTFQFLELCAWQLVRLSGKSVRRRYLSPSEDIT